MTLLAIETATRQLGVAAIDGERLLASYELLAEHPHAVELPGAVSRVLQAAQTTLEQIDAIVVDIGPGSFTGLRIGLAFVKALAFPRRTPVVGIPSLDVLAANVPFAEGWVSPVLDAKQQNIYTALFQVRDGRPVKQSEYLLGPVDEMLEQMKQAAVFLGDGCARYRDQILGRFPRAQIAAPELWLPRAATLARLGRDRWLAGERDDPARLVPMYLYPFDCSVRGPDRPTSVLP
ncbi:MAG: tRNA (adenosine(37)-N6)-threonylcarbamoyltransferase complex dimerization subunit type 1 TsaB [Candidatus Omnitrophica bacterium]|nr:tRNA (adenosine(37)-N6)-threonylcarbamoyltransferase complex dimerization subunit type 1 TsaB [Candidatus Omnitrophota bacterium]